MKNFILLFVLFLVSACSQEIHESSIQWFEGSVDEAFNTAKQKNSPLFLYWGAVWCPPCQEIKHTVFKTRRFIAQSESFVPVYLDGDTDEAQLLGEKFGVKGYPTMILFSAEGVEITRIPGGIDISKYNDILELGLNSIRPTADIVQLVINQPDMVTENDVKQLAYYSWGQDFQALPENYQPDLFLSMSDLAEDEVSKARLYMQYLSEMAQAVVPVEEGQQSDVIPVIDGALGRIEEILLSDVLALACWDTLAYYSTEILPHLALAADQTAIKELWQSRLISLSSQSSLSAAEQLAGVLPKLEFLFHENEEAKLDDATKQYVLKITSQANLATSNSFARQSVINQINYVLQAAHLKMEAKELLLNELATSKSPYYFMSSLASLAEKDDQIEESLNWYRKAYETSVGSATRFQWGASYVSAIIRLQPEKRDTITEVSLALLGELDSSSEVFAGRNFRILRSLNKRLDDWQLNLEETIETEPQPTAQFKLAINQRCDEQAEGSIEARNCESLAKSG